MSKGNSSRQRTLSVPLLIGSDPLCDASLIAIVHHAARADTHSACASRDGAGASPCDATVANNVKSLHLAFIELPATIKAAEMTSHLNVLQRRHRTRTNAGSEVADIIQSTLQCPVHNFDVREYLQPRTEHYIRLFDEDDASSAGLPCDKTGVETVHVDSTLTMTEVMSSLWGSLQAKR